MGVKVFQSNTDEGCCICCIKQSSSRFTSSKRYEHMFQVVFLAYGRTGEICNACVLVVKRFWDRYGRSTWQDVENKRNWSNYLDKYKNGKGKHRKNFKNTQARKTSPVRKISRKHRYKAGAKNSAPSMLDMQYCSYFPQQYNPYPTLTPNARLKMKEESLTELFPHVKYDDVEEFPPLEEVTVEDDIRNEKILEDDVPTYLSRCSSTCPSSVQSSRPTSPSLLTPETSPEHKSSSRSSKPVMNLFAENGTALSKAMQSLRVTQHSSIYSTPAPSPSAHYDDEDMHSQRRRKIIRPRHIKDLPSSQRNAAACVDASFSLWYKDENTASDTLSVEEITPEETLFNSNKKMELSPTNSESSSGYHTDEEIDVTSPSSIVPLPMVNTLVSPTYVEEASAIAQKYVAHSPLLGRTHVSNTESSACCHYVDSMHPLDLSRPQSTY